jgi:ankyrin repeat protein
MLFFFISLFFSIKYAVADEVVQLVENAKEHSPSTSDPGYRKLPVLYDDKTDMVYSYQVRLRSYDDVIEGRPLQEAENASMENIEMLIETKDYVSLLDLAQHHPEINNLVKNGMTPLHHAIRLNSRVAAEIFLSHGFDINKTNEDGETILLNIAKGRSVNREVIEFFISHGANINAVDKQGNSLTTIAIESNNLPMLSTLLTHNADPNYQHPSKGTLLHMAVKSAEYEATRLLLESGASPYVTAKFINTYNEEKNAVGKLDAYMNPLMLATYYGYQNIFLLILSYIKKSSEVDTKKQILQDTAIYALKNGNEDAVEQLVKAGATRPKITPA